MANSQNVTYALRPETVANIELLSEQMFRGKGAVVDYLVNQEIARRHNPSPALVTIIADGKEQVIPAVVTRDFETGNITVVPSN